MTTPNVTVNIAPTGVHNSQSLEVIVTVKLLHHIVVESLALETVPFSELLAEVRMPKMTTHQMEQLLHCLKHYLPMEVRHKVMQEVPQAYNAWMEHEVVRVNFADKLPSYEWCEEPF